MWNAHFTYNFPDFQPTDVIALQGNGPECKQQQQAPAQIVSKQ